ncbi:MAG: M56 family metallopeptidase [Candidatus Scatomorpha sp.]|jgi:beta-lactamase regulating signal transducer with metallopeptidase domain
MADVFIKTLNMGIAAGWLILAVVVFRVILKRAPKRFRLLLWAIVGLRLVLPMSIESALSLVPSAQTLPEGVMYAAAPELNTGIAALNNAINPVFTAAFAPEPAASANPLQVLLPIASVIWLAGAAVMLLWALVSWLRLRRRVAEAVRLEGNVFESERVASPFVLGLIRPRIYLPFGLDEGAREQVLTHERAHIARGDHVIKPLGWLILAVYWYNPLVWLAYALFCRDIELACDERVIRTLPVSGRAEYSQALLDLSRPRHGVVACPLAFGESAVKGRVKSVLTYKRPAFWLIMLAALLCIGAAVCFLTDPKAEADDSVQTNAPDYGIPITVSASLPENFPEQVLEFAKGCAAQQAANMDYLNISAAEITELASYSEAELPEGGVVCLFKLGARYELAEPENVMPAGGMLIENGWLTRADSGGDRFMLLRRDGENWSYVGLTTALMIQESYSGDYDAAVLGEYERSLSSGVTWSSNLAVSSLYGIQFRFEFDLDYTRIEAECSSGRMTGGEPGEELAWTPEPDTTSDTIHFTVYNGAEAVYSGSIAITRIARPSEIANTYLAQLNCHGLAMSAKASNTGAVIEPA